MDQIFMNKLDYEKQSNPVKCIPLGYLNDMQLAAIRKTIKG